MNIKVLGTEELKKTLKIGEVIEGVKGVYEAKAKGDIIVWPLVYHEFEDGKGLQHGHPFRRREGRRDDPWNEDVQ